MSNHDHDYDVYQRLVVDVGLEADLREAERTGGDPMALMQEAIADASPSELAACERTLRNILRDIQVVRRVRRFLGGGAS